MSIILFLIVLSVLVLIHECGHYIAARLFGVKADEFGYGFPPRLIGFVKEHGQWKRVRRNDRTSYTNTIWSINWLPLGGFVRIKGEQGDHEHDRDSFHTHSVLQRLIILVAGVFMNFVLAVILFSAVYMIGANTVLDGLPAGAVIRDRSTRIVQVLPDSPAQKAGLQVDDQLVTVNGEINKTSDEIRQLIAGRGTETVTLHILREGKDVDVTMMPVYLESVGRTGIGVAMADVGRVSLPPLQAIGMSVVTTIGYAKAIVVAFGGLIRDLFVHQQVTQDVAGPVGIAVMTGRVAKQGVVAVLQFAAILSVNLAVINILPIPALDGGRVLFLLIEKLRRRPMDRMLEAAVHNIAFLLLILLIIIVTVHDVSGLISGSTL